MDDDYGADDALLEAMASVDTTQVAHRVQQPQPQKLQQPIPQRLDKAPPTGSGALGSKVVQPVPQALPQKGSGSSILVSPRQRGNPVLTHIKSTAWEYSDIPADYVLGLTTCCLFLSLKYHRLHPEYIYTRIRNLQGKYGLRVVLTMVDIPNHEDSLRDLSKTSLVNNVTLILCWSAAEAARYLELYKSYENANFSAIRGQQSSNYADRLVDFVTVPRSLNKSDAVAMVANFGSLRNAINADAEQLGMISGWGGIKVKRWLSAVEEPFRAKKAKKRALQKPTSSRADDAGRDTDGNPDSGRMVSPSRVSLQDTLSLEASSRDLQTKSSDVNAPQENQYQLMGDIDDDDDDDEDALLAVALEESVRSAQSPTLTQPANDVRSVNDKNPQGEDEL